jgi:chemotaxis protein histidine kinase CheA
VQDLAASSGIFAAAMRALNAAAMVIPAHTLKGEARQFGAEPLADLAEAIEVVARDCVEMQDTPDEALEHIVQLRPLFIETLTLLEREANPIVARKPAAGGFGRRAVPTGFGEE